MAEKYLEQLMKMIDEYQLGVQLAALQMQSIVQLTEQKTATLTLDRPASTVKENELKYLPTELEFLDAFSDISSRTVYRQIMAQQELFQDLQDSMRSLGRIVDQMIELERQIGLRARNENNSSSCVGISFTKASEWIENQTWGYKYDLIRKEWLYRRLDVTKPITDLIALWNLCDDIDFREQAMIQDRLRVYKTMASL
jgi:frataxin-like iron-binding protein CyaY